MANDRQLSDEEEPGFDIYILKHCHAEGEGATRFDYYPTADAPYPDICTVASKILGNAYHPERGEVLELIPVDHESELSFSGEDGEGTRLFREFHEGALDFKKSVKK